MPNNVSHQMDHSCTLIWIIIIIYEMGDRTADLSDTFSVRKMQLLGGQRPPQDLLASQKAGPCSMGRPLAA